MAEPDKRQIGDGSDNYGEAAKQMAKAAKEAGKETAKQAAVKGAEAGANAAAATVQAGVEGGKAVAEIAATKPITARTMSLKLGSIKPVEFSGASGSNLIWMDLPTVTEFAKGPNSPV